ncbi:Pumilio-like protein [Thalictrum thalictroides]|uniref:Pumilio-like protein n=1 Tax=Thalictrum thalictroides TaxID=46969 RepID=A0A7J6UX67_THATH|nr:Pumilio-like protein [Thalictrum thalictroides]
MERRNGEEKEVLDSSSYWGFPSYPSSVSTVSSVFVPPMAENHNMFNQLLLPYDETPLSQFNQSSIINPNPNSLVSAFNRMNLSNTLSPVHVTPSNPKPLINRPVNENPLIDTWTLERGYLIDEINRKNEMIRQMMMAQSLKTFNGGVYDQSLLNPSSDPYSRILTSGVESGKCVCSDCLKGGSNPEYPTQRGSNGLQRCYKGDTFDNLDYIKRLQIYNSQVHQLMNHTCFNSLEEVRGVMVATVKNQNGCKFLQKKLEGGSKEDIEMIYMEIKDYICELMVDQFANYTLQKLFEVCTAEQRNDILISITRHQHLLQRICRDMHGTRAVQKLLECLTNKEQQARFVTALAPGTYSLITDTNGHHVIEYCVKNFPNEIKAYLLGEVVARCVDIAKNRSGCCVLQICVQHSHGEAKEYLVAELIRNALVLSQDQFGNYVVQFLLELKIPQYVSKILRQLEGSFISLSMQKSSSHVVEKCIKESIEEEAAQIVNELISSPDSLKLFTDAFGNYVIQCALSTMATFKSPTFLAMIDLANMHNTSLCNNPHGRRVILKIDQLMKTN